MRKDWLPLSAQPLDIDDINAMNPAVLAFVGDAVQTLYERVNQATNSLHKTGKMHRMVSAKISATSQAIALKKIIDILNTQELAIYKRCRNCKTHTAAKNASIVDYRIASGFEGVIGFLYLAGEHDRLLYILQNAYKDDNS